MDRVGEEEGLRDIEGIILLIGKYTCFWWMSIRAECVRRATFLGRVVWWIFSSERDVLYVCGIIIKTCGYNSLIPFAFF